MIIGVSGKIGSGKDTVGNIIQYLTSKEGSKMSYSSFQLLETRWYNPNDWQIKKFAFKLKQITSILTGIPVEDLEKQEVKDMLLGEEWIRYGYADGFFKYYIGDGEFGQPVMHNKQCSKERYEEELKTNWQTAYKRHYTVRDLLQLIGTEAMRNTIHNNIWVNALMSDYKPLNVVGNLKLRSGQVKYFGEAPNWIITDVRFPNEAEAVKEKGILIRLNRDLPCEVCKLTKHERRGNVCNEITCPQGRPNYIGNHLSETALDTYEDFDYTIDNNGTIEDLIQQVQRILEAEQII